MLKRSISTLVVAGLVTLATPGVSQAVVTSNPVTSFPDFDDTVLTVAHLGSTIYVGGKFDSVTDSTGTYTRRGAAAIDSRTGAVLPWNPNVHGQVRDIAAGTEGVYLVGSFTSVKGQPRRDIARVSPGGKAKLTRKVRLRSNGPVNTVALSKSQVFIGGNFTTINGKKRVRLAAFSRKAPFGLRAWAPKARNGSVKDLVRTKSGVFVAGEFRTLNGKREFQRLALVNEKKGALKRGFNPSTNKLLFDVHVSGKRVYAAVGGPAGGGALALNRNSGATVWERRFDGDVQAITAMNGHVYVGGHFSVVCSTSAQGSGGRCLDGSTSRVRGASLLRNGDLSGWNPVSNGPLGITAFDTYRAAERLLVGGDFTAMNRGANEAGRFAVFNRS